MQYEVKSYNGQHFGAYVRVTRFTFAGEDNAVAVVSALVRESASFHLEPLPDDEWAVEVKLDMVARMHRLLDQLPDVPVIRFEEDA